MINLQLRKPAYLQSSYNGLYSIQLRSQPNKSLNLSGIIFSIEDNQYAFPDALKDSPDFQLPEFTNGMRLGNNDTFDKFQPSQSSTVSHRIKGHFFSTLFSTQYLNQLASLAPT